MSSFLSNKFLKYRNPQTRKVVLIEVDQRCANCSYNLRGLTTDKLCPECGQSIVESTSIIDPLQTGTASELRLMQLGLSLVAMSVLVAAFARLAIFVLLVFVPSIFVHDFYLWLGMMLGISMLIGACIITSQRFDLRYRSLRWMRLGARWLQVPWLIGYGCWLLGESTIYAGTPTGDQLMFWSVFFRALGSIGVLLLAMWLLRLAVDAELDDIARKINLAAFMLPVPSVLLMFVPDDVYWITLQVIVPVLLVWCWFLLVLGRGVMQLQRHVGWSLRIADQSRDHMNRMEQKRRGIDQEVAASVRPTPRSKGDVSLTQPED